MKNEGYLKYLHATLGRKIHIFSCPLHTVINKDITQNWKDYTELSNQISGYKTLKVLLFFLRFYLFVFRERKGERKRERETFVCKRNIDQLPLALPPTRDLACNPDMCLNEESNQQPFGLWDNVQPSGPHQSGLKALLIFQAVP